jgi:hypothetical protein
MYQHVKCTHKWLPINTYNLNPLISSSHVGLMSKNTMVQMTCKSNLICSCKEFLEYIDLKVMSLVLMLMFC